MRRSARGDRPAGAVCRGPPLPQRRPLVHGAFLVGPLVFFNLYVVHDYYFCANALFLSGAVGLLVAGLFAHPSLPRAVKVSAALVCLGGQLLAYERSLGSYHGREPVQPPALAAAIRAVVPKDAVVLVANWGWNPLLPYFMQRRAIMTPDGCLNDVAACHPAPSRPSFGAAPDLCRWSCTNWCSTTSALPPIR